MLLAVIADDLTGALDTGVQFRKAGLSTQVLIHPVGERPDPRAEVVVVDTETRHAAPDLAGECLATWGRRLWDAGARRFYKKIDSTLRGPWEAELGALREAVGNPPVLICPAFPAQGRVVRDGRVWLNGRPVGDLSGLAGNDVVIADAETDADLDALAKWDERRGCRSLMCGSAGLAGALARGLADGGVPAPPRPRCRRVAVVVGSRHPATRQQVTRLSPSAGVGVLTTPNAGPDTEEIPAEAEGLAREAIRRHRETPFDGWVLTGGETAIRVLHALGAAEVALEGEVQPGLPVSRMRGGAADGAWLVTKSGGFGQPETLAEVSAWLKGEG